ncbi:MAG: cell division/cell wall cluster transcriptional repressor MraZ [Gammaproteobacteria bacterium HGW-Gammaproteobacteria-7]|nr:MAG: cell division/cell wall cluster transcriptional repressor MraZ [Gammaproteobacteria bacterium HGW-Gammaproteobacteria-7]
MFQGETAISVDEKGRLAIPIAYRELVARECDNRLILTYNPFESGCLFIYPEKAWAPVRDQINALPRAKKVHRALQLKLVGAAMVLEPDASGRVSLPASHRTAAGIDRKAILVGMGDKFELWSEQAHLDQIRQTIGEDEVSDAMLDLRL